MTKKDSGVIAICGGKIDAGGYQLVMPLLRCAPCSLRTLSQISLFVVSPILAITLGFLCSNKLNIMWFGTYSLLIGFLDRGFIEKAHNQCTDSPSLAWVETCFEVVKRRSLRTVIYIFLTIMNAHWFAWQWEVTLSMVYVCNIVALYAASTMRPPRTKHKTWAKAKAKLKTMVPKIRLPLPNPLPS